MRILRYVLAVALFFGAVSVAVAQVGGIAVTVVDADGTPLPGSTVTIGHATGYVKTTAVLTDRNGVAGFPVLRPGGGYTVTVAFPGRNTIRYDGLRVQFNETLAVSVRMIEKFEERVTVTQERQVVDLDQTETLITFTDEFIQDLPVPGRFYQNVLTLAPGVQDADGDGNPNVHGSRSRDFQAVVGGISNADPLTGRWLSRINPNSIEEMEIITAGPGVEFGRAQGGFARIIQKQGSNDLEGVLEFYWNTSKLDGTGAARGTALEFETLQPLGQLSGPLVKDRLWYRFSYERRDREEPITALDLYRRAEETRDAQITFQASPRNKLALIYRSDPADDSNFGVSRLVPAASSQRRREGGETFGLNWIAAYSPRVLVESTLAWQDAGKLVAPTAPDVDNNCATFAMEDFLRTAQCRNISTGITSGSYFRTEDDRRQRLTLKGQATIYAGRLWGASHQLKLGIDIENERFFRDLNRHSSMLYDDVTVYSLGAAPQHYGVALAQLAIPESSSARATGTNWALYAEDQLKPTHNLTLTVGARVDREEVNSNGQQPFDPAEELLRFQELDQANQGFQDVWPEAFTGYEDFELFQQEVTDAVCSTWPWYVVNFCLNEVEEGILSQKAEQLVHQRRADDIRITNTNVSPYLALSWSPWANGKTAFKATAGRHYNKTFLLVPLQELEPALTEIEYRVNKATLDATIPFGISPTINVRTVDRDLRTPYQDELTFSVERELWPETSLSLTYVDRRFRDQVQDININLGTGDYGRCSVHIPGGAPIVESPGGGEGSGVWLVDAFTDELYEDTDPGPGDGLIDDCVGHRVVEDLSSVLNPWGFDTVGLQRPDGKQDLYIQNPFWDDVLLVGNFNEIDYRAFVLELVRRRYRGWEMNASYTWSEAVGDGEDFFQELGDDPSLRGSVRGFQSYDQRHVVKLNAATVTPWGIRLGTSVSWQSGLPYSLLWEQITVDTIPLPIAHLGTGGVRTRQVYPTGRRNDQRNPSYWNIDLKVTRELELGGAVNVQLSAEIFNLLNEGTYIIYNPFFERGLQINGVNDAQRRFGRRWQLGFKLAF